MVYPAGTGGFGDEGDIATTTTRRVNHGTLACQPPGSLGSLCRGGMELLAVPGSRRRRTGRAPSGRAAGARAYGHAEGMRGAVSSP
jgi:hypothetical protein